MPSLDFEAEKAVFRDYYNDNLARLEQAKRSFLTLINSLLSHNGIDIAASSGRIKDREESIKKFARKYQTKLEKDGTDYAIADHITDLIGLRLVCLYEDEVERIGTLMDDELELIELTDKSAEIEGTDNLFGYKGLHLDLRLNPDRAASPDYAVYAPFRFELQIRTIVQDSWSTLDHKIKYKKSIPPRLKRRINTLAALFELADREFVQVRDATIIELEKAQSEIEPEVADDELPENDVGGEGAAAAADASVVSAIGYSAPGQYAPLDAFRLLRIAKHFFPDEEFEPRKLDGFTAEVVSLEPTISRGKLNYYMKTTISLVRRYRTHFLESGLGERFNAFTQMRHALYVADPEVFAGMLTNNARETFDAWRRALDANAGDGTDGDGGAAAP